MTKSLEGQLDEILKRYHLMNWKESGLEVLIKYAQKEKEYWEPSDKTHLMNDMTKIIRISQALMKKKE